jgi:hypothetical protein
MNRISNNHSLVNNEPLFFYESATDIKIQPLAFILFQYLQTKGLINLVQSWQGRIANKDQLQINKICFNRLNEQAQQYCEKIQISTFDFLANLNDLEKLLSDDTLSPIQRLNLAFALGKWEYAKELWAKQKVELSGQIDLNTFFVVLMWERGDWLYKLLDYVDTQMFLIAKLPPFWSSDLACCIKREILHLISQCLSKGDPFFNGIDSLGEFDPIIKIKKALLMGDLSEIKDAIECMKMCLFFFGPNYPLAPQDAFFFLWESIFSEKIESFEYLLQEFPFILEKLHPKEMLILFAAAAFVGNQKMISYFAKLPFPPISLHSEYLFFYQRVLVKAILSGNIENTEFLFNLFQSKFTSLSMETMSYQAAASSNRKMIDVVKSWENKIE